MTVVTIFATGDGFIESSNVTYLTARSTPTTAFDSPAAVTWVGQTLSSGNYGCFQAFLYFDTSVLPAGGTSHYTDMGTLHIRVYANHDDTTPDPRVGGFDIEVASKTWRPTVTTGDWVAGASLAAVTNLVHSSDCRAGQWVEFPEALDPSTFTPQVMLYSSKQRAGTAPTVAEYIQFYSYSTAGTTSDPYCTYEYFSTDTTGGYLAGALGPVSAWGRVLSQAEVQEVMALGMTIFDRPPDKGTAVIQGDVRTRTGAIVPATHVRAGWWVQNLEANNRREPRPKPLLITGHSVDPEAKKNALTIGADWMEDEIGVKMADLLAIPLPAEVTATDEAAADPYQPESTGSDAEGDAAADATEMPVPDGYATWDAYYQRHPWMAPSGYDFSPKKTK